MDLDHGLDDLAEVVVDKNSEPLRISLVKLVGIIALGSSMVCSILKLVLWLTRMITN